MKRTSFIIFLFISTQLFPQSTSVPLDYWGYQFIERLETKGLFSAHDLRAKPISRTQFAKLIFDSEKNKHNLSSTDQKLFLQLQSDFYEELNKIDLKVKTPEPHLLTWEEQNSAFVFDLYGRESIISNRGHQYDPDELLSETTMGGIVRGNLGRKIGFYVDARNSITRGSDVDDESFDLSEGSPVVTSGPNVIRDRAVAYFVFEKPWARLELGRNEIEWGPSYRSGVSISRNMPPADMIRLSSRFKNWKFSSSHVLLSSSLGSKYLAAHRIDWMVKPGFYLGASESVVYGGRNVEFSYLNPLMPYHVAEHHLGDKDNNTLSVDVTSFLFPGTKLYAEFFIDDMTSTKSWTSYFGNKFGIQLGSHFTDPLGLPNTDLHVEYTRIEPYVYTHWDSINIYTHYDKVIGSWLGPNSDDIYLELCWQVQRDFRATISFEQIRQGVGGVNSISRPEEGEKKEFLKGTNERRQLWGLKLTNQIRRDLFVAMEYTYSDGRNLAQIPGNNSYDHLARSDLYFNY